MFFRYLGISKEISLNHVFRYLAICRPLSPLARSTTGEARRVSALPSFFCLLSFLCLWVTWVLYLFSSFFFLFLSSWPPCLPSLNHHMSFPFSYPTAQTIIINFSIYIQNCVSLASFDNILSFKWYSEPVPIVYLWKYMDLENIYR